MRISTVFRSAAWRRVVWFAAVVILLYAALGFWGAPVVIRREMLSAAKLMNCGLEIGRVRVNPFTLTVGIEDLKVGGDRNSCFGKQPDGYLQSASVASVQSVVEGVQFAWPISRIVLNGRINAEHLAIAAVSSAVSPLPATLSVSQGDFSAHYRFSATGFELSRAEAELRGVEVQEKQGAVPLVAVPSLEVHGGDFDFSKRRVEIDSINMDGAKVSGYTPWSFGGETSGGPAEVYSRAPGWEILLKELTLKNGRYFHEDRSFAPPLANSLEHLNLTLTQLRIGHNGGVTVEAAASPNGQGEVRVHATAQFSPLSVRTQLEIAAVNLVPLSAYLGKFLNLDLASAVLSAQGDGTWSMDQGGSFQGQLGIADLNCTDRLDDSLFMTDKALNVSGIEWREASRILRVGEVAADGAAWNVTIRSDGLLNTSSMLARRAQESAVMTDVAPYDVRVGKLVVHDSRLNFRDESLKRPLTLSLEGVEGEIQAAPNLPAVVFDMRLQGRLIPAAPVDLTGKLDFSSPVMFQNLVLSIHGGQLASLNDYSRRYLGRDIREGSYDVKFDYQVQDKKLHGENQVVLKKLRLGNVVANEAAASSLPLELGIALLRKPNGDVELTFPAEGDPRAPEFSFGGLIREALLSAVTKILSSPFAVLASLISTDEELDHLGFAFGSAELSGETRQKLDNLARALAERPELKLGVAAPGDLLRDKIALGEAALAKRLGGTLDDLGKDEYAKRLVTEYAKRRFATTEAAERKIPERLLLQFSDLPQYGTAEALAVKAMELVKAEGISEERVVALARERGAAVRGYLVGKGSLAESRITVEEPHLLRGSEQQVLLQLSLTR